jgi:SAM-dependent methyltransferase
MMSVVKSVLKSLLRRPANALIASSSRPPAKIMNYLPYPAPDGLYVLEKPSGKGQECENSSLPVPEQSFLDSYGVEDWLDSGKKNVDTMLELLTSTNFAIQKGNRILDFGCSSGRMIRWLAGLAEDCEIWGVDISARQIVWCQENLTPPFNFATVTIEPHLPFEDRYFDLIYCGSVFTHIDDLAEAWLLELKRIMKPGGRVYITVHDKHTADLLLNHIDRFPYSRDFRSWLLAYDKNRYFEKTDYYMYVILPGGPESQVFYDIDYLRKRWGRILNIISITPEAYWYQTAVLMEKVEDLKLSNNDQ